MTTESICTVCQRTVYLPSEPEDDAQACPVCSTPLLAANKESA